MCKYLNTLRAPFWCACKSLIDAETAPPLITSLQVCCWADWRHHLLPTGGLLPIHHVHDRYAVRSSRPGLLAGLAG